MGTHQLQCLDNTDPMLRQCPRQFKNVGWTMYQHLFTGRVAMVMEKHQEKEHFSRSEKTKRVVWLVRKTWKVVQMSGNFKING